MNEKDYIDLIKFLEEKEIPFDELESKDGETTFVFSRRKERYKMDNFNFDGLSKDQQKQVVEQVGYTLKQLKEENPYLVCRGNWTDYASELFDDCYLENVDSMAAFYIDYERWAVVS